MSLREYQRKRDFSRTAEPKGSKSAIARRTFVVQKHWATRLHYDFRLELGGTLKSWAVPKGPSLDTSQRRLAVQVEDHPLEYATFEGVIPQGEYGGGVVMVWDIGLWAPLGDAERDYREGKLKFVVQGKKLSGSWMLVRMPPRASDRGSKPNWLLIKERDVAARPLDKGDILEEMPTSALTGRTMEEIKEGRKPRKRGGVSVAKKSSRGKASSPRKKTAARGKETGTRRKKVSPRSEKNSTAKRPRKKAKTAARRRA